jgi:succinoglycan biosynthesis protein ExoM
MIDSLPHISVCVCTYRRPHFLAKLLDELSRQKTEDRFTYSIVVADNDRLQSAELIVLRSRERSDIEIKYCFEPRQNIALARNKAVENATGNFIAFIDDDECPTSDWLLSLFITCQAYAVDGVLGPVKPRFEAQPPAWIIEGKFYERPTYKTGFVIDGAKGRTGNVLLKKQLFTADEQPFNPKLLTGEDQDFFWRMIDKGHVFVWCQEAVAYEIVPAIRWKRSFMLRRALLRGKIALIHPKSGLLELLKSAIAVPSYALALPFLLMLGQGTFMRYLIKIFDHAGRLLAAIGIDPIKDNYVTE